MGKGFDKTYMSVPEQVAIYRKLYVGYLELGRSAENLKYNANIETMCEL